jgi:hypothetical protein
MIPNRVISSGLVRYQRSAAIQRPSYGLWCESTTLADTSGSPGRQRLLATTRDPRKSKPERDCLFDISEQLQQKKANFWKHIFVSKPGDHTRFPRPDMFSFLAKKKEVPLALEDVKEDEKIEDEKREDEGVMDMTEEHTEEGTEEDVASEVKEETTVVVKDAKTNLLPAVFTFLSKKKEYPLPVMDVKAVEIMDEREDLMEEVEVEMKEDTTCSEVVVTSVEAKKTSLKMMASTLTNLLAGKRTHTYEYIEDIVTRARESSELSDFEDTTSFKEIMAMISSYREMLGVVATKYVGDINFKRINPTALYYYLEYEDERKNPSWKRRMHRFCPGLDVKKVIELNEACDIALICYGDTVESIREGLAKHTTPYELVYADVRSEPGKPAHFMAVKRDQLLLSPYLEVIVGVRGTKTVADALTDLLCDVAEYRGGYAHSFILNGGKHLAEKHVPILEKLLHGSGKKKIRLTLIGHSLGAGAASIAGIELNDHPKFEVNVIGFGCPALLSKELAEKYTFIQTIVNDSDIVPRLSGIAVANMLLNIMEFDWVSYAKRDVEFYVDELQRFQPKIFNETTVMKIKTNVLPLVERQMKGKIKKDITERVPVQLYPP